MTLRAALQKRLEKHRTDLRYEREDGTSIMGDLAAVFGSEERLLDLLEQIAKLDPYGFPVEVPCGVLEVAGSRSPKYNEWRYLTSASKRKKVLTDVEKAARNLARALHQWPGASAAAAELLREVEFETSPKRELTSRLEGLAAAAVEARRMQFPIVQRDRGRAETRPLFWVRNLFLMARGLGDSLGADRWHTALAVLVGAVFDIDGGLEVATVRSICERTFRQPARVVGRSGSKPRRKKAL
jgi:hypothetical protein